MTQELKNRSTHKKSFLHSVINDRSNLYFSTIAILGGILQLFLFKVLYPFPDFYSDSYRYLYAAYAHLDVNILPIGYSKFLTIFHYLTSSDTALIAFQYFFLETSGLYFFLTVIRFYPLSKINKVLLFIFIFFNPLLLYISNYISSDALFAALSLIWFSQLIRMINNPSLFNSLLHTIALFGCVTFRNEAYLYIAISIFVLVLTQQALKLKFLSIILAFALILPFVLHTRQVTEKMTGTKQISLNMGWQLVNNALYIYDYADTNKELSAKARELDQIVLNFYMNQDSDYHTSFLSHYAGDLFIRVRYSPLKNYLSRHYKGLDDDSTYIVAWGKCAPVFSELGKYIITHNIRAYISEFIIPNGKDFLFPPMEILNNYNQGTTKIEPIAVYWFRYKADKVSSKVGNAQSSVLFLYPTIFLVLHFYLIVSSIFFWYKDGHRELSKESRQLLLLSGVFLLLNFLLEICSFRIVLRYELFSSIVSLFTSLLLLQWLGKKAASANIGFSKQKVNTIFQDTHARAQY